jgi:hypothetical protein
MAKRFNKEFEKLFKPYMFVLKEGKQIKKNPLDYSLLILQVSRPQIIKSPAKQK